MLDDIEAMRLKGDPYSLVIKTHGSIRFLRVPQVRTYLPILALLYAVAEDSLNDVAELGVDVLVIASLF